MLYLPASLTKTHLNLKTLLKALMMKHPGPKGALSPHLADCIAQDNAAGSVAEGLHWDQHMEDTPHLLMRRLATSFMGQHGKHPSSPNVETSKPSWGSILHGKTHGKHMPSSPNEETSKPSWGNILHGTTSFLAQA